MQEAPAQATTAGDAGVPKPQPCARVGCESFSSAGLIMRALQPHSMPSKASKASCESKSKSTKIRPHDIATGGLVLSPCSLPSSTVASCCSSNRPGSSPLHVLSFFRTLSFPLKSPPPSQPLRPLALPYSPSEHTLVSLSVVRKLHEALTHSRLHPQQLEWGLAYCSTYWLNE